jgi:hypothetical protein
VTGVGAAADYSFSVYCKDAVYDSEITGPYTAVPTGEAITDGGATSMAFTGGAVPTAYALYQSVPNPNDGSCSIRYDLPESWREDDGIRPDRAPGTNGVRHIK